MKCQELQDLIPDYLAEEISPETRSLFEAHLAECENCRVELEQMSSAWAAIGELPDEEPGPLLRSRFYSMLEEEKRAQRAQRVSWFKRFESWMESWWPRRPAVQMAMGLVVLVVGLAAGAGMKRTPVQNGDIAELRNEVQQMHQMVSLSLLNKEASSDRLRGVNWSTRVTDPSETLLSSLTHTLSADPNENVRLAAADALSFFRDKPGVVDALIRSLSDETSPMVQVALIDLLTDVQEKRTLESLRNFIEMQDVAPPVKQHAENRLSDYM